MWTLAALGSVILVEQEVKVKAAAYSEAFLASSALILVLGAELVIDGCQSDQSLRQPSFREVALPCNLSRAI